nr:MAG: replication initiator protein [Microvirus sp.]
MAKCPHSFVLARPGGHDRFERLRFDHSIQVVTGITVPCGKCLICRQNRAREWAQRLKHEMYFHKEMCFITLTYDEEHIPYIEEDFTLWKNDLQLFWKRLRKRSKKIKYLACGEYGERTSRPHYHAIIFGWQPNDVIVIAKDIRTSPMLEECWGYGQVSVGGVEERSLHYVTGYVLKKLPEIARGARQKEFICASQGMGLKYAEMYEEKIRKGELLTDGKDKGIPMYYRRKIIDKIGKSDSMDMRLALKKRAQRKDVILEQTLRSRGKDLNKQVERARRQSELELEAKISRRDKSGL